MSRAPSSADSASSSAPPRPGARRVLWISSSEAHEILLVGAAILVMALALVMTLSRAGIGIFVLVLVATRSLAGRREAARWKRQVAILAVTALAGFTVTWVGIDAVATRFLALPGSGLGGRVAIWRDTLTIIRDFPWTGSGLNSYGTAMLYYQTFGFPAFFPWAHNDYLQLAAESGLLVGIPIAILAALLVRQIRSRLRENTDWMSYAIRVGAVTGLGAIAF